MLLSITDWVTYFRWNCTGSLFFLIITYFFCVPFFYVTQVLFPSLVLSYGWAFWQWPCLQRKTKWTVTLAPLWNSISPIPPFYITFLALNAKKKKKIFKLMFAKEESILYFTLSSSFLWFLNYCGESHIWLCCICNLNKNRYWQVVCGWFMWQTGQKSSESIYIWSYQLVFYLHIWSNDFINSSIFLLPYTSFIDTFSVCLSTFSVCFPWKMKLFKIFALCWCWNFRWNDRFCAFWRIFMFPCRGSCRESSRWDTSVGSLF